jgi:hypothetical protein
MYHTVGNVLWTLAHDHPPRSTVNSKELVVEALSMAQHVLRCNVHTTLGSSPGLLGFNRDVFLNIPLIANLHLITTRREHLVNKNLRKVKTKRRTFDHTANQKMLKKQIKPKTLGARPSGLYTINQVHSNGTMIISLGEGVTERINIRRVIHFIFDTQV